MGGKGCAHEAWKVCAPLQLPSFVAQILQVENLWTRFPAIRSHKSSQQLGEETVIYNSTSHLWLPVCPKLRINGFWRGGSRTMCKVTRTTAARRSQTHIAPDGYAKEFKKKMKNAQIFLGFLTVAWLVPALFKSAHLCRGQCHRWGLVLRENCTWL